MPVEITYVTTANVVIANFEALNSEQSLRRFFEEADALASSSFEPDGALSLDFPQDRISVVRRLDGNTQIKREFPIAIGDLNRLAKIADLAIVNTETDHETHTFGFNVEATCTQRSRDSSSRYLAEQFFDVEQLAIEGFRNFGSSTWEIEFSDDQRRWRLGIRRLDNAFAVPNLYVTLNSHYSDQTLPDRGTIRKRLRETWEAIPKFIEKLERKS